jgi:TonB family protein
MGRVKQFFGGSEKAVPTAPKTEVAAGTGISEKIEGAVSNWEKSDAKLVDKTFSDKKSFRGLQAKTEFAMSTGKEADAIVQNRSIGTASSASPNLKEKTFQVSKRDMPFQIASAKEMDQLSNVNMVPVSTGKKTSAEITSLDSPGSGGVVGGAALKSKSIGSSANAGSSSGFSGMTRPSGGSSGSGGGASGGLAMGSSSGGGMIDAGGIGTGYSGSGTGGGGGTLGGQGRGKGGGGGQGGGSPYGVVGGMGTSSSGMLPRRQLSIQETVANTSRSNGETITGELSRRPIREKYKPPYEMDARVALRFRVNAVGKVLDGIVVEVSSGSPSFDNKVIAALKQWLFSALPAEKSNVIQEGVITFIFRGE